MPPPPTYVWDCHQICSDRTTWYLCLMLPTTLKKGLWTGCSPSHERIGYISQDFVPWINSIHHGRQSNPNSNRLVWKGDQGKKNKKGKWTLDPAWFLKGYFHHLARGQRRDLILARVALGWFLRGYFMGWHKPTPSVTCRWTGQAGLIRSETQRAIASLDNKHHSSKSPQQQAKNTGGRMAP